ncbi:hypothetical protein RI367_000823 [Sorochytrium milnesiophthora]
MSGTSKKLGDSRQMSGVGERVLRGEQAPEEQLRSLLVDITTRYSRHLPAVAPTKKSREDARPSEMYCDRVDSAVGQDGFMCDGEVSPKAQAERDTLADCMAKLQLRPTQVADIFAQWEQPGGFRYHNRRHRQLLNALLTHTCSDERQVSSGRIHDGVKLLLCSLLAMTAIARSCYVSGLRDATTTKPLGVRNLASVTRASPTRLPSSDHEQEPSALNMPSSAAGGSSAVCPCFPVFQPADCGESGPEWTQDPKEPQLAERSLRQYSLPSQRPLPFRIRTTNESVTVTLPVQHGNYTIIHRGSNTAYDVSTQGIVETSHGSK